MQLNLWKLAIKKKMVAFGLLINIFIVINNQNKIIAFLKNH